MSYTDFSIYDLVKIAENLKGENKDAVVGFIKSKLPDNVKPIPTESFEKLPPDLKAGIRKGATQLSQKSANPKQFRELFTKWVILMYNFGMADAVGGDLVDASRVINVEKGQEYFIQCPYCAKEFDINLEGMLQKEQVGYYVNTR